ncbi:hypothetical protein FOVG_11553 [Fusarium oxysporum f. sp. pisi HDV247]|uniref:GABA permease n=1 Tax=Fusarium oxysporum f. sp. pisi HDV247 TaxID=1080344 RepID=W9PBL5_FUSOX|nr:hypothetical protein FOVG_11553 [Fusarium oxysporum f. sp. pisi HDV247]
MPTLEKFDSASRAVSADQALANLGYKNELKRTLSIWTILGLSVAIMGVPFGLSTTLYITLVNGQSVTVLWGWVFVTLCSICIASSLAEICAVYPTAGGPYFWSAMVSTRKYAPIASWITGWLNLVGNFLVTTSINFSGAQIVLSVASLFHEEYVATPWQTVLAFWAFTLLAAAVNVFGTRYLSAINVGAMIWTAISVGVFMIVLLVMAKAKRSASFVFTHYDASASGWPTGWSFFVGLLQGGYVMLGYGLVASLCEEVENPHLEVPRAMVISVVVSGFVGLAFLIPVLFTLPDVATLLAVASNQPIGTMFKMVTGSKAAAVVLLVFIIGIFLFASIGAFTAASRYTYAFARDGAIPGHLIWSRMNKKLEMPLMAMLLNVIVSMLLGFIYFGSSAAFNSFTGTATICLSTSYATPILASLIRSRKPVHGSAFSLRSWGFLINGISVSWIFFSIILFCMPVTLPVTASSMNYSSVVFMGFGSVSVVWYIVYGRKHYKGPVASMEEDYLPGVVVETPGHEGEMETVKKS